MAGKSALTLQKREIIKKFGSSPSDTGKPEVQIALITTRINELNGHFKNNPMDHHSKRGLLKLVGQRRRLLNYVKSQDPKRYQTVLKALDIRK